MYRSILAASLILIAGTASSAGDKSAVSAEVLLEAAPGWQAEVLSVIPQSYAGWDVEIGDADNDGANEVLVTGCPDSQLYLLKKKESGWDTRLLAENLARHYPGMGLTVKVVDLNQDGRNEIILGTGEEGGGTAFFWLLETNGEILTRRIFSRPECNESGYTHNFGVYDLDDDGIQEVISAYCGGGEVIRYDVNAALDRIEARKITHLSGSGEESLIEDVDNDGRVEFITSNSFRHGAAKVEIFEFDDKGELIQPPRLVLDGFENTPCFYASIMVGDVDNDGASEMVVGWKKEQNVNRTTLLVYRVGEKAEKVYTLEKETGDLDMSYFEKMMCIADADNDGARELVISTRGDNQSEHITSPHLGHVYIYDIKSPADINRTLVADFDPAWAESSWVAVGDADNDGENEILLATGKGDRMEMGLSYVVLVKKTRK